MSDSDTGSDLSPPVDLRRTLGAVVVPRDVVRVAGPEAVAYLHGQLSQDVENLDVGATTWSFVLQPAGKVDAWVRLTRMGGDELLIDVDGGFGEGLVARLRRFLLRTKADIEQLDWTCVALRGPGATDTAHAVAGAAETAGTAPAGAADAIGGEGGTPGGDAGDPAAPGGRSVLTVPAGWPGVEGTDLLGPAVTPPSGVAVANREAYEALRIRSGVPAMGAELTDRTIPAEAGQWIVDGSVSFAKGCFTGQELVARIDSRGGNVPRHLRGLVIAEGEPLPLEAPVTVDGKEVGRVTSAARAPGGGSIALAYLGRAAEPPILVDIHAGSDVVAATAVALPMD